MSIQQAEAANRDGSLLDRLQKHIAILAPHQLQRLTGQLLVAATKEIERLGCNKPCGSSREEIQAAIVQTVNQIGWLQIRLKSLRAMQKSNHQK